MDGCDVNFFYIFVLFCEFLGVWIVESVRFIRSLLVFVGETLQTIGFYRGTYSCLATCARIMIIWPRNEFMYFLVCFLLTPLFISWCCFFRNQLLLDIYLHVNLCKWLFILSRSTIFLQILWHLHNALLSKAERPAYSFVDLFSSDQNIILNLNVHIEKISLKFKIRFWTIVEKEWLSSFEVNRFEISYCIDWFDLEKNRFFFNFNYPNWRSEMVLLQKAYRPEWNQSNVSMVCHFQELVPTIVALQCYISVL